MAQVRLQSDQIDQVLKAMTLEEKAMLVVGGNLRTENQENNGMVSSHSHLVPGAAGMTRAIERLGIPATVLTDLLLHGLPCGHCFSLYVEY